MKKLNFKGVTVQTWVRTIVLALALISQILVLLGKSDKQIDEEQTARILTTIFTAIASVWAWWKNNSFTQKAQDADEILYCGENETSIVIDEDGNEIGSGAEVIEKLIYPVKNARITQGYHKGSSHYGHSHSSDGIIDYSLDDGEKDTGCNDYIYAPCTLRIVEIYTSGTNTLWWESVNKVLLANGKLAYVCGYIIHCPDSSLKKLKVGQIIKQGEKIAQEGMDGATGYHFHHAVALGRCKKLAGCPRPWKKNAAGYYVLTSTEGAIRPELAYWMNTKFTKILDGFGYSWRKTSASTITDGKYANGTYTVNTDVLNVRSGPGTEFDKLSFDKLTTNAQKQIKQLNKNKAANGLVRGCTCTVSETIGTWGKIPSGWICLDYCKKNK